MASTASRTPRADPLGAEIPDVGPSVMARD
jgi:hypothetical protein